MPISIVDAWPIDVQNLDITNAKILKDGSYQRLVDIVDDPQTDALAGLSPTADTVPYFTSATTSAVTGLTAFARTLLDDPNASTALTTLGVSSYVQTILDDVDAATARSTLGADLSTNVNFTQAGAGAVTRTVSAKLREIVSVKDFGAVGDGVVDDTAAIAAAVAAVGSTGTVYFPSATSYKITSTITLPQAKFVKFKGDGFRLTEIRMYNVGVVSAFTYARGSGQSASIFEFEGLQIVHDGLPKRSGCRALSIQGFSDGLSDNSLRVYRCAFYGWDAAIYSKWTGQCRVVDCWFQTNTYSAYLQRGCSFWKFDSCMSYDATFVYAIDGTYDAFSNGLIINSCDNITPISGSVYVEGWQAVYISGGCGFDLGSGGTAALWFKQCHDVTISDAFISSDGVAVRDGVFFDSCHTAKVNGCTVVNNEVGIRITGVNGVATKIVVDGNKFEGNETNDAVFSSYVTACKWVNNHHVTQMARTGTNYEIYANTTGTDQNVIAFNTLRGTSYTITTGAASVIVNNIFSCPAG